MNNKIIDVEFYSHDGVVEVQLCRETIMWRKTYLLTEHRKKLFISFLGKERFAVLFLDNFVT